MHRMPCRFRSLEFAFVSLNQLIEMLHSQDPLHNCLPPPRPTTSSSGSDRLPLKRDPIKISGAILGATHTTLLDLTKRLELVVVRHLFSFQYFLGRKDTHAKFRPDVPFFGHAVWIATVVDEARHRAHERGVDDELVGHVEEVSGMA